VITHAPTPTALCSIHAFLERRGLRQHGDTALLSLFPHNARGKDCAFIERRALCSAARAAGISMSARV
jgi:hypothetical protein